MLPGPFDTRSRHVDHGSGTGRVPGVLCFSCNAAVGQFKDRPDVLRGGRPWWTVQLASVSMTPTRSAGVVPSSA
ncbi:endonuclease domain-containing protein [Streptomyces albidoflavus]